MKSWRISLLYLQYWWWVETVEIHRREFVYTHNQTFHCRCSQHPSQLYIPFFSNTLGIMVGNFRLVGRDRVDFLFVENICGIHNSDTFLHMKQINIKKNSWWLYLRYSQRQVPMSTNTLTKAYKAETLRVREFH